MLQKIKLLPLFPPYSTVRNLLVALMSPITMKQLSSMQKAIKEQIGTPQNPLDWRNPDQWIEERLEGENREIAKRLWKYKVNPRYIQGALWVVKQYQLIQVDDQGNISLSERGKRFLDGDQQIYHEIDQTQGIFELLSILGSKDRVQRKEILPEWEDFLLQHTNYSQSSAVKDTLRRRLNNLEERGYVIREGFYIQITELGIQYFNQVNPVMKQEENSKKELLQSLENYNAIQRELLRRQLFRISPYQFERLIKDLLEAMGYEDVEVTKASGDHGVDLIASIQFGITTIKEVIQVKRVQGSVGRPVLDQLRGALHYFGALRGTIITTGTFTKQCKAKALFPGAAPIGLIDGERLLDLLFQHDVGVKKRKAILHEVDEAYFTDNLL